MLVAATKYTLIKGTVVPVKVNNNNIVKVKVKQSRYRPGVAQTVPGS